MTSTETAHSPPASFTLDHAEGTLVVRLAGDWRMRRGIPSAEPLELELTGARRPTVVVFDSSGVGEWDTGILVFLVRVKDASSQYGIEVDRSGLPAGVQRLLALAEAVPEKSDARAEDIEHGVLERIGETTMAVGASLSEQLEFIGAATSAFGRMLIGKARYRRADMWLQIQQAGVEALPIVALVSFLLGLILAFVGAIQLQAFGAQIYVANLVGVAMVRDMGALIAAIVMAGRSGGAYAAQLGSMNVNQEIDALQTTGIPPLEFLVLPRMTALFLMMPLLSLYAGAVGIL
ncbi:MAG: ABC transporter permease, partial [Gemmatimonadales bacterium]